MKPYRFSFVANGSRHYWVRFYSNGMEHAFSDCKNIALKEYHDASGFNIESDQDSMEIRKSWGLSS